MSSTPPDLTPDLTERLQTVDEVAERLQISTKWLYTACKRGDFPHVKVGNRIRFTERQVRDWIEGGGRG